MIEGGGEGSGNENGGGSGGASKLLSGTTFSRPSCLVFHTGTNDCF